MKKIHRMIRQARMDMGYSRSALAQKLGISVTHMCDLEKGLKVPSTQLLCKLERALGAGQGTLLSCNGKALPLAMRRLLKVNQGMITEIVLRLVEMPEEMVWIRDGLRQQYLALQKTP
jgi:transcriptional regulator with XRE-family HTH domain